MPKNITRTKVVKKDENGDELTSETEIERASLWDRATSIATMAGIVIALITAWLTILGYFHQLDKDRSTRESEQKTKERESKKIFFDKQSELYFHAVTTAAAIAMNKPPTSKDVNDFENMYWGSMAMVEDDDVDQAMVLFRDALDNKGDGNCLRSASLFLAHCVKKSLALSWAVKLGEPPEIPCTSENRTIIKNTCNIKDEDGSKKRGAK
jgi:hypothetical protein